MTWLNIRRSSAPIDCAERTQISFTAFTPVQLLKMTGKADTKPTSSTAEKPPRPHPEQEQRRVAGPGMGREERSEWHHRALGPPRAAHQHADGDAEHAGQ